MKKAFFIIFLCSLSLDVIAQQITLSEQAEISVITVDPGNNLNDAFGHSAFRVKDNLLRLDVAYNYGIFDYDTPNFYGKFAQGKLLYDLASYPFSYFYKSYVAENRSIKEQVLNLSIPEKRAFFDFLQNNAKPENKSYYYDFFYDNCATKLKDVAQNVLKEKVVFTANFTEGKDETLRSLIHQYTEKNHPWGTFGIDLALGSIIDKKATVKDYHFLPDHIFNAYAESTLSGKPIVKKTNLLFTSKETKDSIQWVTPTTLFSALALLVLGITYRNTKNNKRSKALDFVLLLSTGLVGTVVVLLWFATDHTPTKNNFNVLWAFMPNLLVAFVVLKKEIPKWVKYYLILLILLLAVTALLWLFKLQIFAVGIIPVLLFLLVRYVFLIRFINSDVNVKN